MPVALSRRPGFLGPVIYQAYVNGVPYANRPPILDASLTETFGQHDLFTLRIEYPRTFQVGTLTIWPDNTPVAIQWGQSPDLNWWFGYVSHHEVATNADSGSRLLQLTYTCIGTSATLNSVVTTKWESVTPTYISKSIAAANGFRAVTNPSNWLLDYEQQAETDFQFLNRLANKCGMRFWCSGGTLYMIAPTTSLEGSGQSAIPAFYTDKSLNYQDTCRDLVYLQGKNLPGSVVANRTLYGIDAISGQPFSASAPASGTSRVALKTSTPTTSYADAANRVNSWAALSQFWIGASATLYGNTHLYPGKVVQLTGSALPSNAAGYWLVSSVTHNLSCAGTASPYMDKYLADVVLLKNNAAASVALGNITPVTPEFTNCSLNLSGRWISTNLSAVSA
jgi:phage protein D